MSGAKSEEQKLVDFFRSDAGDALGRQGDYDGLLPAETAIRAMRELVAHSARCKRFRQKLHDSGVL